MNKALKYPCLIAQISLALMVSGQFLHAQHAKSYITNINDPGSLRGLNIDDIFSSDYLRDSTLTVEKSSEGWKVWHAVEKLIYIYNNQGQEAEVIKQLKDQYNWVNQERFFNEYNLDDLLLTQRQHLWSNTLNVWQPQLLRQFNYNYRNDLNEITENRWFQNKWMPESLITYSYDDKGNMVKELLLEWLIVESDWKPNSQILYVYDSNDALQNEVYQSFSDSTDSWVNDYSRDYAYGLGQRLESTRVKNWDAIDSIWISVSVSALKYNGAGQLEATELYLVDGDTILSVTNSQEANYDTDGNLDEVVHSVYNAESKTWEETKKQMNFWSVHVSGNLAGQTHAIDCVFANPYIPGLPMYCKSLKPNITYSMELCDIWGRKFYGAEFKGADSFKINRSVPPGMYVMSVHGGLDFYAEKIIIQH